jgi:hypothetical protein
VLGRVPYSVGPVGVLLLGEDESESAISSGGGFPVAPIISSFPSLMLLNSEVRPGGGVAFDVLRLALIHFHSLLTRKVEMPAATAKTIAYPVCLAISYKSEVLLTEPGGGGTARDGVWFPMATRPSILYRKMRRFILIYMDIYGGGIDGLKEDLGSDKNS